MKLVKTSLRLADGRQLLYFDEREGIDRRAPDTRDLAPAVTSSQIRCDPLLEEWVIVASHRQGRTHLPPADQCPLCPSRDGRATEIPAADYDVVVFENRFPSLASDPGPVPGAAPFRRQAGVGRCEVVCFTADHDGALARLPVRRIRTVVEVWADRTLELGALEGVEQVFPFENRGEEIGVTLHHPHGQIYAYPFVAPRTARQLDVARAHQEHTGECRTCSIVAAEAEGERVVATAPGWLLRSLRGPLAVRGPPVPDPPPARPPGPGGRRARRPGGAAQGRPRPVRRALRPAVALYADLPPGAGAARPRPGPRPPGGVLDQEDGDGAQVPGLQRVRGRMFINDIAPEQAAELLRAARPGGR